jgi:hypothetical protein
MPAPFLRVEILEEGVLNEVDKVEFTVAGATPGMVHIQNVLGIQLLRNLGGALRELKALGIPETLSHQHLVFVSMTYEELREGN